ncbi:conserved hypothetical protein [Arthrobacter sp. Hiyo1]|nr:conserved hypothetical protein [Arthrobacter sp. Hiyo1]
MTVANGSGPHEKPAEEEPGSAEEARQGAQGPSIADIAAGYAEKAGLQRNSHGTWISSNPPGVSRA